MSSEGHLISEAETALAAAREAAKGIESETLIGRIFSLEAYDRLHKAFLRLDAALYTRELLRAAAPLSAEPEPAVVGSQPFEIRMQLLADLADALRQRLSRVPSDHALFLGIGDRGYELASEMLEAVKLLMPPSQSGAPSPIEEYDATSLHGTVTAMGFLKGREHERGRSSYSTYTMCWLDVLTDLRSEDEDDQLVRLYVEKDDGKCFKIGQRIEIRLLPGQGAR